MKKIIAILMICGLIIAMSGCGNMAVGLGNYTYKKVHINTLDYSGCIEIEKWYDTERGIEVMAKEVGSLFLSEGTYILIGEKCPICAHGEGE